MAAKIASRQEVKHAGKKFHFCTTCNTQIRPTLIIKRGKGRMIKGCACLWTVKTLADTKHLLS